MAVTYPLNLPTNVRPATITIYADTVNSVSVSPYTLKQQIHSFDGDQWKAEITLPQMKREKAQEWVAFLTKLKGAEGTFLLGDSVGITPLGVATGTPQINGNQSKGINTLNTKGWTASVTGILKAGDFIQVGNRLYMNLQDVNSDGAGDAVLDIFPRLREAVVNSDTIITERAKGLFRLVDSSQRVMTVNRDKIYTFAIKAVEAI